MHTSWTSRSGLQRASGQRTGGKRPLALICDDEELILDLLDHHLSNHGFEVTRAANGQQALDHLQRQLPDVMILDVMMPCVQGDEVLRRIRGNPDWRHIPVLMLTMRTEETDVVYAFEVGASDYLTKPFTSAELMARVTRLVAPSGQPPENSTAPGESHSPHLVA